MSVPLVRLGGVSQVGAGDRKSGWVTRSAELSEAVWARIEPLMPQAEGRSRPWCDHRQVVAGIGFRYRTGGAGRDLPGRSDPWQTVWKRHHRVATEGLAASPGSRRLIAGRSARTYGMGVTKC